MTTTAMMFDELTRQTSKLHEATVRHPIVQGIGAGSLSEETFRFYLEQDYQFLLRYVGVLAHAAASAPDLDTMLPLGRMVTATIEVEIDALRELYRRFGGEPMRLDRIDRAPTCAAYTNHLRANALEHDTFVTLAAILPCHWGYHDIGLRLKEQGLPDEPRYAAWIEEYASAEYGELVEWAIGRFNQLGEGASATQRVRAQEVFELSSQYELGFWEMARIGEQWPDPDAPT